MTVPLVISEYLTPTLCSDALAADVLFSAVQILQTQIRNSTRIHALESFLWPLATLAANGYFSKELASTIVLKESELLLMLQMLASKNERIRGNERN